MTIHSLTATQLGTAIRAHHTTAVQATDAALHRIQQADPALGAFVVVDDAGARAVASEADRELAEGIDRGLLHGVPVAVKDIFDITGLPTTCGSATSFGTERAETDAHVVDSARRAGAVIVGKTVLHEFAFGATGDRSAHGPSRNPHDQTRVSGGSSGGSAVAVASGMVPLSMGTDTAGSVRVPAALCGIVGFKPAFDALSTAGVYPLAPSLDHVGVFATSVADAEGFSQILGDTKPNTAIATPERYLGWIDPAAIAPTDSTVTASVRETLTKAGFGLQDATSTVRDFPPGDLFAVFTAIQGREAYEVHRHHLEHDAHLIDPGVLARLQAGGQVSEATYADARRARTQFAVAVDAALAEFGVLALPTTPITAPLLYQTISQIDGNEVNTRAALLSLTSPWNMTGSPAISIPGGELNGLPLGIQLITSPGNEATLFATAALLEHTTAAQETKCPPSK